MPRRRIFTVRCRAYPDDLFPVPAGQEKAEKEVAEMGKIVKEFFLAMVMVFFFTGFAYGAQPGRPVNPSGFPSGDHFTLNIIAKGSDLVCPGLIYDEYGYPAYGNVIYIPELLEYDARIILEPGKEGTGSSIEAIGLQVTDACTGFAPNDPASLRFPKNDKGYRVYARVLGMPSGDDGLKTIEIFDPQFQMVKDESGTDLLSLGLVTENGFLSTSASFVQTTGRPRAVDITGLFQWSGSVCRPASPDESGQPDSCCTDADGDGIFDRCSPVTGDGPCEGAPVYCTEYMNEWIFNVGDFVDYFWNLDRNGAKMLQIRFYPQ